VCRSHLISIFSIIFVVGLSVAPAAADDSPQSPRLDPYFVGQGGQKAFWDHRWKAAIPAFKRWLAAHPKDPNTARAQLLLNVSRLYGGDKAAAARGFEKLVPKLPGLKNYVHLLAAEAWVRSKNGKAALRHLRKIGKGFAAARRASLLTARAHAAGKARHLAATGFKAHLSTYPNETPAVWMEAANALEAIGDKKGTAAALRQMIARAPTSGMATRAAKRLKGFPRKARWLRVSEQLVRVRAEFEGKHPKAAIKTANRLIKRTKAGSNPWCEATYLKARSLERLKKRRQALPVYDAAAAKCGKAPADLLVKILYFAGKRHMSGGSAKTALKHFAAVPKASPKHTYVDDTLMWAASVKRGQGNNKAADAWLRKVIDAGGDMQEAAAWRLFWHHYEAGHLIKASKIAEQAVEKVDKALQLKSRGRLLYWLGRVLQRRGRKVRSAVAYARTIREYPLGWYAQLAQQRLQAMDEKAAKDAIAASRTVAPVGTITAVNKDRLRDPGVSRAVELLRLGLRSYAQKELQSLELGDSRKDVDWLAALLYDRAGDHTASYRIARFRRPEHATFYPTNGHEERWKLAHPKPAQYVASVRSAAKHHKVDPHLIWAVMRTESAFKPAVVSFANAVGLMQLIVPTGRAMAKQAGVKGRVDRRRLTDPKLNIQLGSRYLGGLSRRFNAHPALMAAGYNAGPGGPMKWLRRRPGEQLDQFVENIPYNETRRYVKSVVTAYLRYRTLYGKGKSPSVALRLPRVE